MLWYAFPYLGEEELESSGCREPNQAQSSECCNALSTTPFIIHLDKRVDS